LGIWRGGARLSHSGLRFIIFRLRKLLGKYHTLLLQLTGERKKERRMIVRPAEGMFICAAMKTVKGFQQLDTARAWTTAQKIMLREMENTLGNEDQEERTRGP
jgi:hypothetical protein